MIKRAFITTIILLFVARVFAQTDDQRIATPVSPYVSQGRIVTIPFKSKLMNGRLVPYRVVLPTSYWDKDATGRIFPVVYLLHGLTGHFENWTTKTNIVGYSEDYEVIIVTPEGDNGWYTDSVSTPNDKYESYVVKELIPEIDKKFRTIAERRGRVIAGLSMGGYGAIKFGLKYPEMFSLVGSFSGALGVATFSSNGSDAIGKSIKSVFGDSDSETRKNNDIFKMIRELSPEKQKSIPFIYLSCGTEDFLIQNNREFLALLNEKKVPHEYRELPGGHTWAFWGDQVREFLAVIEPTK